MHPGPASDDFLATIVAYHAHMGRRLLNAAAKVPDEELASGALSQGTLFDTLLHVLDASYSWRMVAEEINDTRWVWEVEPLKELPALRAFWEAENQRLASFVESLTAEARDRVVEKHNWQGHPFRVWQVIVHIVTHQVEHGNEIGWHLTRLGHSPGGMGFIAYVDRAAHEA